MITRPLLSGTLEDISKLKYPVYATPKLDGIRVLKVGGKVLTRKFKELPNSHTREKLTFILPDGIDGEVVLRSGSFNDIQSQIMSFDGEPDYIFYAFDFVKDDLNKPYLERMKDLKKWYDDLLIRFIALSKIPFGATTVDPQNFKDKIRLLLPVQINDAAELLAYENQCLLDGYEGVMIRKSDGKYKCGRSTEKESILLKMKRFQDAEAIVLGFKEKMTNENAQEQDKFGLAKRSHKKEGMVPADTLGALLVRDINTDIEFEVGSGFDDVTKKEIWDNQSKYLGKAIKYKFQPVGLKEKPRFPVFLGFRHIDDL